MRKFAFLVAVAVVAGVILALLTGTFSGDDGDSASGTTSVKDSGNSATAGQSGTAVIQNGNGTVNNNTTVEAAPQGKNMAYGDETDVRFTIENESREGVWELSSPVMRQWSDATERPANGVKWLAEGVEVTARCALPGTSYPVTVAGVSSSWHFFAELANSMYVPIGGFSQATHDGSQHLKACISE